MSLLQKVCCFFLFGKMLLYLCPDEKYEAYYSLLLEWSMFAVIVLPLLLGDTAAAKMQQVQKMWESIQQEVEAQQSDSMSRDLEEKIQDAVSGYADEQGDLMEEQGEMDGQENQTGQKEKDRQKNQTAQKEKDGQENRMGQKEKDG